MARKPHPAINGRDVAIGAVIKIYGRWCRIVQFQDQDEWSASRGVRFALVAAPGTDPRLAHAAPAGRSVTGRHRMVYDDDEYLTRDQPAPRWESVDRSIDRADGITTPCAVCAVQARRHGSDFWRTRGQDWPTKLIGERQDRRVHLACASDAEHLTRAVTSGDLAVADGVGRWAGSGQAVPGDTAALLARLGLAPGLDLAATAAARDAETAAVLAAYRTAQAARPPGETARHEHELLVAFGAGETIVDVVTGQVTRT